MKKFEQKLLETGSLELICSYVEEHKDTSSKEFQEALAEKIKGILQAFDFELSYTRGIPTLSKSKEEILNMDVANFLGRYYRGSRNFPKSFYEQCRENNIKTAKDLLEVGRHNVARMRKVGRVTSGMIEDAFDTAGIDTF